ncbi:MAG TPA: hypothetical protein VJ731_11550 [Terriglobales bacterium]|nr:hypothetical protein [Terriglobales bacterium]
MYDAKVVGAGPAELTGALILGRCCRLVLVRDGGHPRDVSQGLNGVFTRDEIKPLELQRIGIEQLGRYDTVEVRDIQVTDARHLDDHQVEVTMADGTVACTLWCPFTKGVSLLKSPDAILDERSRN